MSSLNAIIDAVSATVTQTTGLRTVGLTDKPQVPCAMVYPDDPVSGESYYEAFKRGVFTANIVVQILMPSTAAESQSRILNDYLSPAGDRSIAAAIYAAPTLGTDPDEATAGTPTMTAAVVRSPTEYGFVNAVDGTRFLSAKVHVQVTTRGDT